MKLISCNNCGVVLDQDKLSFADDIYDDQDSCVDPAKGEYDQDRGEYFAYISCPACKEPVFKED
jgi:hypothetical protein